MSDEKERFEDYGDEESEIQGGDDYELKPEPEEDFVEDSAYEEAEASSEGADAFEEEEISEPVPVTEGEDTSVKGEAVTEEAVEEEEQPQPVEEDAPAEDNAFTEDAAEDEPAQAEEEFVPIDADDFLSDSEYKMPEYDKPVTGEAEKGTAKKKDKKKPKKEGGSKFGRLDKKKKALIIGITALVLVIALVLGITIPIVVANKDKIFVSAAEDFARTDKGTYFVLKKDVTVEGDLNISVAYPIDLNGKTLTVTGSLIYNVSAADTTKIYIGTMKKKEYVAGGKLAVGGDIVVNAPVAEVHFISEVEVDRAEIQAKEASFSSAVTAKREILYYGTGTLTMGKGSTVDRISVGTESSVDVYGRVNEYVKGVESGVGKAATFRDGAYCAYVADFDKVRVNVNADVVIDTENVAAVYQLEKLQSPKSGSVVVRGNTFEAVVSEVPDANEYEFFVNGTQVEGSFGNVADITRYITTPGEHEIKVNAKGYIVEGERLEYEDSDAFAFKYKFTIQLSTPVAEMGDNGVLKILFDENVAKYDVTISKDGAKAKEYKFDGKDSGEHLIGGSTKKVGLYDLSQYLEETGTYYITIKANSKDKNSFSASETAAVSFVRGGQITVTPESLKVTHSGESTMLSWAAENAKLFKITVARDGFSAEYFVTKPVLNLSGLEAGSYTVTIEAKPHSGYKGDTKTFDNILIG